MTKSKTDKDRKPDRAKDEHPAAPMRSLSHFAQRKPDRAKDEHPADGGWRETVESIAMAVILALLFRGFVAEAFVIPTGSMAPTLQGRHKDVICPKCGVQYQVSGSDEQRDDRITGFHVSSTTCPICRYTQRLDPLEHPNQGSFSGDRIIVGKFVYDLGEPQRWDVIVFKFPNNAVQNYIKRLVGLPGEKLWIVGGNIYTCGLEEPDEALRIARKPPHKLDAMLQLVDDTNHIPQELTDLGWPARWQPWPAAADASAWKMEGGGRTFVCDGSSGNEAWLRYRHLVPTHADWTTIELERRLPSDVADRPGKLIADYYAYNTPHYIESPAVVPWGGPLGRVMAAYQPPTGIIQRPGPGELPNEPQYNVPYDFWRTRFENLGQHWVDDLAVECLAEVTSGQGELSLLLVRGGVQHRCTINLADGKATLSMLDPQGEPLPFVGDNGAQTEHPAAQTSVRGRGRYRLRLSNCDHEMLLWVNGRVVSFDGPTTYESDDLIAPFYSAADPGDLAPAGVASRGAAVTLSRLRILRDKYYVATTTGDNDYSVNTNPAQILDVFRDPSRWAESGLFADRNRRHVEFRLEADQFLPLGDNSPQSSDGRYWYGHHYVERDLLIGKALLIYWPHTWNRPIPFFPNFRKMGPIR